MPPTAGAAARRRRVRSLRGQPGCAWRHSRKCREQVSCKGLGSVAMTCRLLCALLAALVLANTVAAQDSRRPPLPLEVTFSAPVEGEADVRLDAIVRIQFSRDVDARSLEKRIRMSYSAEESAERGEAQPPSITFEARYQAGSRALEIKPSRPLER